MKISSKALLTVSTFGLLSLSSLIAHGRDMGFRFDDQTGTCRNAAGIVGLNPEFLGQCGDLSGFDLRGAVLPPSDRNGALPFLFKAPDSCNNHHHTECHQGTICTCVPG